MMSTKNLQQKKPRQKPSDVKEGKTIFIRNIDLETDETTLINLFTSFGTLEYCKICYDEYSGKSKGSAFVKFKKKEDADKCLEEANIPDNLKFYLDGKQLIVTSALSRHQLEELRESQSRKHKDKRNLYLAREGLIYPDSPAAAGVSQNDLKKRLMLEEKKRKLLQNLHYFVSDNRICIHNLPLNYDDEKLRKLFLDAAGDKRAKILWAKVMRNRSKTDQKFGKSKGFGFVEFNEHVHALKALRHLNNNPEIFTVERRPIVEFSIENKVALNRKKYRLMKQQKLNPKAQINGKNNTNVNNNKIDDIHDTDLQNDQHQQSYSGVNARPFDKNEKVIKPKLNRKILEHKKKLKSRNKKMKHFDKPKTTETMNVASMNKTIKQTKKEKKKKSKLIEEDELENRYLKRKFNFIKDTLNVPSLDRPVVKKQKWYI